MVSLNRVLLIGNLTRDPELRTIPNGTPVAEFGLAVNRQWRNQNGEQQEDTAFVDIVVWGKQGETVHKYCRKGRPVFVEGRLQYDSWEGKDGQKKSRLRVVADTVQFLGAKPGEDREAGAGSGPPRRFSGRPPEKAPPPESEPAVQERPPEDLNLDDIPF